MTQQTLAVKDANTTTQNLGAQQDAPGYLVVEHCPAPLNASGVATPVSPSEPMPVIVRAGSVAVDGSGTIVSGGAAQNLFSGITPLNGYLVANLNASGGRTLYISDVGAAAAGGASIPIAPQATFVSPSGYAPPGAVSIFGTNTGDAFAARRW